METLRPLADASIQLDQSLDGACLVVLPATASGATPAYGTHDGPVDCVTDRLPLLAVAGTKSLAVVDTADGATLAAVNLPADQHVGLMALPHSQRVLLARDVGADGIMDARMLTALPLAADNPDLSATLLAAPPSSSAIPVRLTLREAKALDQLVSRHGSSMPDTITEELFRFGDQLSHVVPPNVADLPLAHRAWLDHVQITASQALLTALGKHLQPKDATSAVAVAKCLAAADATAGELSIDMLRESRRWATFHKLLSTAAAATDSEHTDIRAHTSALLQSFMPGRGGDEEHKSGSTHALRRAHQHFRELCRHGFFVNDQEESLCAVGVTSVTHSLPLARLMTPAADIAQVARADLSANVPLSACVGASSKFCSLGDVPAGRCTAVTAASCPHTPYAAGVFGTNVVHIWGIEPTGVPTHATQLTLSALPSTAFVSATAEAAAFVLDATVQAAVVLPSDLHPAVSEALAARHVASIEEAVSSAASTAAPTTEAVPPEQLAVLQAQQAVMLPASSLGADGWSSWLCPGLMVNVISGTYESAVGKVTGIIDDSVPAVYVTLLGLELNDMISVDALAALSPSRPHDVCRVVDGTHKGRIVMYLSDVNPETVRCADVSAGTFLNLPRAAVCVMVQAPEVTASGSASAAAAPAEPTEVVNLTQPLHVALVLTNNATSEPLLACFSRYAADTPAVDGFVTSPSWTCWTTLRLPACTVNRIVHDYRTSALLIAATLADGSHVLLSSKYQVGSQSFEAPATVATLPGPASVLKLIPAHGSPVLIAGADGFVRIVEHATVTVTGTFDVPAGGLADAAAVRVQSDFSAGGSSTRLLVIGACRSGLIQYLSLDEHSEAPSQSVNPTKSLEADAQLTAAELGAMLAVNSPTALDFQAVGPAGLSVQDADGACQLVFQNVEDTPAAAPLVFEVGLPRSALVSSMSAQCAYTVTSQQELGRAAFLNGSAGAIFAQSAAIPAAGSVLAAWVRPTWEVPPVAPLMTGPGPDGGRILFLGPRRVQPGVGFKIRFASFVASPTDDDHIVMFRAGVAEADIESAPTVSVTAADLLRGYVEFPDDLVPSDPGSYLFRYVAGEQMCGQTTVAVGDSSLPPPEVYPVVSWRRSAPPADESVTVVSSVEILVSHDGRVYGVASVQQGSHIEQTFTVPTSDTFPDGVRVRDGIWSHLAAVVRTSGLTLLVNGSPYGRTGNWQSLKPAVDVSTDTGRALSDLVIGTNDGQRFFRGHIQHLAALGTEAASDAVSQLVALTYESRPVDEVLSLVPAEDGSVQPSASGRPVEMQQTTVSNIPIPARSILPAGTIQVSSLCLEASASPGKCHFRDPQSLSRLCEPTVPSADEQLALVPTVARRLMITLQPPASAQLKSCRISIHGVKLEATASPAAASMQAAVTALRHPRLAAAVLRLLLVEPTDATVDPDSRARAAQVFRWIFEARPSTLPEDWSAHLPVMLLNLVWRENRSCVTRHAAALFSALAKSATHLPLVLDAALNLLVHEAPPSAAGLAVLRGLLTGSWAKASDNAYPLAAAALTAVASRLAAVHSHAGDLTLMTKFGHVDRPFVDRFPAQEETAFSVFGCSSRTAVASGSRVVWRDGACASFSGLVADMAGATPEAVAAAARAGELKISFKPTFSTGTAVVDLGAPCRVEELDVTASGENGIVTVSALDDLPPSSPQRHKILSDIPAYATQHLEPHDGWFETNGPYGSIAILIGDVQLSGGTTHEFEIEIDSVYSQLSVGVVPAQTSTTLPSVTQMGAALSGVKCNIHMAVPRVDSRKASSVMRFVLDVARQKFSYSRLDEAGAVDGGQTSAVVTEQQQFLPVIFVDSRGSRRRIRIRSVTTTVSRLQLPAQPAPLELVRMHHTGASSTSNVQGRRGAVSSRHLPTTTRYLLINVAFGGESSAAAANARMSVVLKPRGLRMSAASIEDCRAALHAADAALQDCRTRLSAACNAFGMEEAALGLPGLELEDWDTLDSRSLPQTLQAKLQVVADELSALWSDASVDLVHARTAFVQRSLAVLDQRTLAIGDADALRNEAQAVLRAGIVSRDINLAMLLLRALVQAPRVAPVDVAALRTWFDVLVVRKFAGNHRQMVGTVLQRQFSHAWQQAGEPEVKDDDSDHGVSRFVSSVLHEHFAGGASECVGPRSIFRIVCHLIPSTLKIGTQASAERALAGLISLTQALVDAHREGDLQLCGWIMLALSSMLTHVAAANLNVDELLQTAARTIVYVDGTGAPALAASPTFPAADHRPTLAKAQSHLAAIPPRAKGQPESSYHVPGHLIQVGFNVALIAAERRERALHQAACGLLLDVCSQCPTSNAAMVLVQNDKFDRLLRNAAGSGDAFIRECIVGLCEDICGPDHAGGVRAVLRQQCLAVLSSSPNRPQLVLDVLECTYRFAHPIKDRDLPASGLNSPASISSAVTNAALPAKPALMRMVSAPSRLDDAPAAPHSATLVSGVSAASSHAHTSLMNEEEACAVFTLLERTRVQSAETASTWAMCIKLLHLYATPGVILRAAGVRAGAETGTGAVAGVQAALQAALTADRALLPLVEPELVKFTVALLGTASDALQAGTDALDRSPATRFALQQAVLSVLAANLARAASTPASGGTAVWVVYHRLFGVLRDSLERSTDPAAGVSVDSMSSVVGLIADMLSGSIDTLTSDQLRLLLQLVRTVTAAFAPRGDAAANARSASLIMSVLAVDRWVGGLMACLADPTLVSAWQVLDSPTFAPATPEEADLTGLNVATTDTELPASTSPAKSGTATTSVDWVRRAGWLAAVVGRLFVQCVAHEESARLVVLKEALAVLSSRTATRRDLTLLSVLTRNLLITAQDAQLVGTQLCTSIATLAQDAGSAPTSVSGAFTQEVVSSLQASLGNSASKTQQSPLESSNLASYASVLAATGVATDRIESLLSSSRHRTGAKISLPAVPGILAGASTKSLSSDESEWSPVSSLLGAHSDARVAQGLTEMVAADNSGAAIAVTLSMSRPVSICKVTVSILSHSTNLSLVIDAGGSIRRLCLAGCAPFRGASSSPSQMQTAELLLPALLASRVIRIRIVGASSSTSIRVQDIRLTGSSFEQSGTAADAEGGQDADTQQLRVLLQLLWCSCKAFPSVEAGLCATPAFGELARVLFQHLNSPALGSLTADMTQLASAHDADLSSHFLRWLVVSAGASSTIHATLAGALVVVCSSSVAQRLAIIWQAALEAVKVAPGSSHTSHVLLCLAHALDRIRVSGVTCLSQAGVERSTDLVTALLEAVNTANRDMPDSAVVHAFVSLLRFDDVAASEGCTIMTPWAPAADASPADLPRGLETLSVLAAANSVLLQIKPLPSLIDRLCRGLPEWLALSHTSRDASAMAAAALTFLGAVAAGSAQLKRQLADLIRSVLPEMLSSRGPLPPVAVQMALLDLVRACVTLNAHCCNVLGESIMAILDSDSRLNDFGVKLFMNSAVTKEEVFVQAVEPAGMGIIRTGTAAEVATVVSPAAQALANATFVTDTSGGFTQPASRQLEATSGSTSIAIFQFPMTSGSFTYHLRTNVGSSSYLYLAIHHAPVPASFDNNTSLLVSSSCHLVDCRSGRFYLNGKSDHSLAPCMNSEMVMIVDIDSGTISCGKPDSPVVAAQSLPLAGQEWYFVVGMSGNGSVSLESIDWPQAPVSSTRRAGLGVVGTQSNARWLRPAPVFESPSITTVSALTSRLMGGTEGVSVSWQPISGAAHSVPMSKHLRSLLVGDGSLQPDTHVLDLAFSISWPQFLRSGGANGLLGPAAAVQVPAPAGVVEAKSSEADAGASGEAASPAVVVEPSLFTWLSEHGGLGRLCRGLRSRVYGSEPFLPASAKASSTISDISDAKWWQFLRHLEAYMQVPGFAAQLGSRPDSLNLLLQALGAGASAPQPSADACALPALALLAPMKAFGDAGINAPGAKALVESGSLDCLLLLLAEVHAVRPRFPANVVSFEDPQVLAERERQRVAAAERAAAAAAGASSSNGPWAAGTGYSSGSSTYESRDSERAAEIAARGKQRNECTVLVLSILNNLLNLPTVPEGLKAVLDNSAVLPVLMSFLRASELDITTTPALYTAVYQVLTGMSRHASLVGLLDKQSDMAQSVVSLLAEQVPIAKEVVEDSDAPAAATAVMNELVSVHAKVTAAVEAERARLAAEEAARAPPAAAGGASGGAANDESKDIDQAKLDELYQQQLSEFSVTKGNMQEGGGYSSHHYASMIKDDASAVAKNQLKRVKAELRDLKSSLPVFFGSSILLRHDAARPYVMQALIFAPHDTPYDSGAFLFDVYCTPAYPTSAPKVNLMTTGGGTVRFNPNLYHCGKVCLSLLGTWHGGSRAEEWTENSTLLQVLVSIQSLIFISNPYFNEPGYEQEQGTPQGERNARTAENGGWERLRVGTVQWAMLDQLRNPPAGFEEAVKKHFLLKRAHILKVVDKWVKDAQDSDTPGHLTALKTQVDALKVELRKLGPSPCDALEVVEAAPEPAPAPAASLTEEQQTKLLMLQDMAPESELDRLLELLKQHDWHVETAAEALFS